MTHEGTGRKSHGGTGNKKLSPGAGSRVPGTTTVGDGLVPSRCQRHLLGTVMWAARRFFFGTATVVRFHHAERRNPCATHIAGNSHHRSRCQRLEVVSRGISFPPFNDGVAIRPNRLAGRIGPSERARFVLLDEARPAEVLHVDDQILAIVAGRGHGQALASQVVKAVRNLLRT